MTDYSSIDSNDEQLIYLLRKDGRQSSEALARQLKVSPSTVQRRIRKLVQDGIVRIAAVVDPTKSGLPLAVVATIDANYGKLESVVNELARQPAVNMVSKITGRFDILAFMRFRSNDELSEFLEGKLANINGILNSETFVCLRVMKGQYTLLNPAMIESNDKQLISLLQKDGRQKTEVLARQLKVSPSTVQRRIRKLVQDGTIRIAAIVDPSRVGLSSAAAVGIRVAQGKLVSVMTELARESAVRFVSSTTGRFDMLAFMRFQSNDELSEFLEEKLANTNGITNSETFICLDVKYGAMYIG